MKHPEEEGAGFLFMAEKKSLLLFTSHRIKGLK
jgi:hypothetical protein